MACDTRQCLDAEDAKASNHAGDTQDVRSFMTLVFDFNVMLLGMHLSSADICTCKQSLER